MTKVVVVETRPPPDAGYDNSTLVNKKMNSRGFAGKKDFAGSGRIAYYYPPPQLAD
jgi:hypothetical protein